MGARVVKETNGAAEQAQKKRKMLDQFNPARTERVDTVTILAILIAFNIPLFAEGFKNFPALDVSFSYFFGALTLVFFLLYLVDYYEKIWKIWFSLPSDPGFFRVYGLVVGSIIIAAMSVYPQYWHVYLLFLFVVMTIKKFVTAQRYQDAFVSDHGQFEVFEPKNPAERVQGAVYLLSKNMSWNFFIWGTICGAIASTVLLIAYRFSPYETLHLFFGVTVHGKIWFVTLSAVYSLVLVVFWYLKISRGLSFIASQVEKGEFEFFEKGNR